MAMATNSTTINSDDNDEPLPSVGGLNEDAATTMTVAVSGRPTQVNPAQRWRIPPNDSDWSMNTRGFHNDNNEWKTGTNHSGSNGGGR